MDFSYIGGTMGSVVGEKITRAIELADKEKLPLIVISDLTIGVGMQIAKNAINGVITLDHDLMEDLVAASWDSIKK